MSDQHAATLRELADLVLAFSRARDWEQYHNPKDLALALAIEVGEVLEHFRFQDTAAIASKLQEAEAKRALGHELADCLWLILRLADVCELDLAVMLREKVALAEAKYPVETSRGRNEKYHRLPRASGESGDWTVV
jgi:dCTP diphosphatase